MLCVCILGLLTIKWLMLLRTTPKLPDVSAFASEIELFRQSLATFEQFDQIETEAIEMVAEYFYFDPNRATDEEWDRLGLNRRQIQNIRNYQAAGGSFRRKEDLQRLFTISATQYRQLEPYIRIAASAPVRAGETATPTARTSRPVVEEASTTAEHAILRVELNLADSSLLTQLPGIGPVLAARTLRYRNLIGGFVDVAQLSEVYGVSSELTERLAAQIWADSLLIRKIPVNTANINALARHPYISEQQARGIVNYRRLQNHINNIDELVRNNILEREDADKIRPYLSFE